MVIGDDDDGIPVTAVLISLVPSLHPAPLEPQTPTQHPSSPAAPSTIQYPKFITDEVLNHLKGLADIPGWLDLVQNYLEFEVASPSDSVSDICFYSCDEF